MDGGFYCEARASSSSRCRERSKEGGKELENVDGGGATKEEQLEEEEQEVEVERRGEWWEEKTRKEKESVNNFTSLNGQKNGAVDLSEKSSFLTE